MALPMMKALYVLWAIFFGICIGFVALLSLPFVLLYATVQIISGCAGKIK